MSLEQQNMREALSALVDGELDEPQRQQVLAAVKADPALAAELAGLQAVRDAVRSLPQASAPAGMSERILAAAAKRQDIRPAGPARFWGAALAAAGIVAVFSVGVSVFYRMTAPAQTGGPGEPIAIVEPAKPAPADTPIRGTGGPSTLGCYGGSDADGVINQVIINSAKPAEAAKQAGDVFNQNGAKILQSNRREDAGSICIQNEVVINEDQRKQIIDQLRDLGDRQGVPQEYSGNNIVGLTRPAATAPASAPASGPNTFNGRQQFEIIIKPYAAPATNIQR